MTPSRTRMAGRHRLAGSSTLTRVSVGLPLLLLSVSWTIHLVDGGPSPAEGALLPSDVQVPVQAMENPASYSTPGRVAPSVPRGSSQRVVASASTHGIPSAALTAYQRAETVINAADKGCNLPWQLVAAIGRVESDHGRYGGNALGADGVSRPGIYGIALDGTNNTAEITDTDAGQFDNDEVYDRAVGPMQFIPSTWAEVGVDADGDAKRNPQDIDDAALASAVYLCSGDDDLGRDPGRRAAVYRYNHSREYVDLVLSVMDAYADGHYSSVPTNSISAVTFTVDSSYAKPAAGSAGKSEGARPGAVADTEHEPSASPPTTSFQPDPSPQPKPNPEPASNGPARQLEETVQKSVKDTAKTVSTVLSLPQAILKCSSLGYNALTTPSQWNACIADRTH